MDVSRRIVVGVGVMVFLAAAAVYLITLTPSVPFWDSGEFIAVSYILGIPHPPGTPFYVLIGRIATLVPWATVAQRVNALSAISAALAVLLTYLTTLKLIRIVQGPQRSRLDEWIAVAGSVTGALLLAFSDSFWENSIEAEVYALMSLAQILVLWLGLRWWEAHEARPTAGPLMLCVYVMWLCVGLHLGVGIMGLPLLVLVWMVDWRAAVVFAMPFLSVLLVTKGLEFMAGGVLGLLTLTYVVYAFQRKLNGWFVLAGSIAALVGMMVAFNDQDFTNTTALIAVAGVLIPLVPLARKTREGKIIALALLLMAIGYSTHLYLPIRAAQHPAINEGNPSTWDSLRDLLERKQYGSSSMFVRRAPWSVQLDKEFWRYFSRQWPLFPTDRLWGGLLPILLGVAGAVWQFRRNKTTFLTTGAFVALTTAGMILFLNFSPKEVRERDYFFQSGYHSFSIWIGLGAAWLITWVRDSFADERMRRWTTAAAAALMLFQPLLLLKNMWFTHDRRGFYVAHDYAYNMLAPLAKDAWVVTNGDNDTFPLWYMQQVENFRKDVRVVNLSLLNTDWYITQLRDEEPKLPITLDDASVRQLGQGAVPLEDGTYIYTNRFMIGHLMDQNRLEDGGWKKPGYFAVTVPERMGLDKYFTLEGLVQRINADTLGPELDVPMIRKALYETFQYRGLFKADGSWDSTVYKDENASTLSHNYAMAHVQLALHYQRTQELPLAIAEMERVERMFPSYVDALFPLGKFYLDVGDTAKSVALFERMIRNNPGSPDAHYYFGLTKTYQGGYDVALQSFDRTIALDPDYYYAYLAAYSLLTELGQREKGIGYLERWVAAHPTDQQTRALLDGASGRPAAGQSLLPAPVQPPLP